jgi:lipopolysaccharide transport system ATP-binding protein
LKILSRITEPTEGRVEVQGRVASLLEVGTGFHPELTGRENIFLNGAILGMTRSEIRKKFDEIVAFAEVERFLDTPVKRYSSGMYVRLAFAVAAHLEPEILIVDEVLAVGDSDFQKKCLGKMDEVSRAQGRAVLFVSHNMGAVAKLCTGAIHFEAGHIRARGSASSIISGYLSKEISTSATVDLTKRTRSGQGNARITTLSRSKRGAWVIPFPENLSFCVNINALHKFDEIVIGIGIFSSKGFEVASWSSEFALKSGSNSFEITFQNLTFVPGDYSLGIALWCDRGLEDRVEDAAAFEVSESAESGKVEGFKGALVASASVAVSNGLVPDELRIEKRDRTDLAERGS